MKLFWTDKRLEALSKTSLTLFQAFLIAVVIGGALSKISSIPLKVFLIIGILSFFIAGLTFADKFPHKEA